MDKEQLPLKCARKNDLSKKCLAFIATAPSKKLADYRGPMAKRVRLVLPVMLDQLLSNSLLPFVTSQIYVHLSGKLFINEFIVTIGNV